MIKANPRAMNVFHECISPPQSSMVHEMGKEVENKAINMYR